MATLPRSTPNDLDLVTDAPCPLCYKFRFQFLLRCDLGFEACLPVIRCQNCGHTMELKNGTRNELKEASLHKSAGCCPQCASESTRLVMACDLRHRKVFVTGRCEDCRIFFAL